MIGIPKIITAPATEPLTLSEAKLYLRVDSSDDDDLSHSRSRQLGSTSNKSLGGR